MANKEFDAKIVLLGNSGKNSRFDSKATSRYHPDFHHYLDSIFLHLIGVGKTSLVLR